MIVGDGGFPGSLVLHAPGTEWQVTAGTRVDCRERETGGDAFVPRCYGYETEALQGNNADYVGNFNCKVWL